MNYKFELNEQPTQTVLSIRTRTPVERLPEEIGKAYGAIMNYLEELGEKPVNAPFAAYYNMDMNDLDVEMGFPVSKSLPEKGELKSSQIPAGKMVSYLYKGPYNQTEPVYTAMLQWVNENGYTATGVAYEFYYNSPLEVPESELLTKIVFPLKD